MRVRKLSPQRNTAGLIVDAGGDFTFGRGLSDYFVNDARGVAQTVETRLRLFIGDFFLDSSAGTPWRTAVLGKYTGATRDIAIRTRILQTPGVNAITSYGSTLDRDTRAFSATAQIDTIYGPAPVAVTMAVPS